MFAETSLATGATDVIRDALSKSRDVESDTSTDGEVSADEELHADATTIAKKFAEVSSPSSTQAPSTPLPKEHTGNVQDDGGRSEGTVSPISAPTTPNVEWGQGSTSSDNDNSGQHSDSEADLRPTLQKGRGPHRYSILRKPAVTRQVSSGISSCSSPRRVKRTSQPRGRGRSRTPVRKPKNNHRAVPSDNCQAFKPGDWFCARCGDLQFARRSFCRMCGSAKDKPSTEEERSEEGRVKPKLCERERRETDEKWQRQKHEWRREENEKLFEALATSEEADRSQQRDVFVGNLPSDCYDEDVVNAFEALFNALPNYRERYQASSRPLMVCRCKKRSLNGQCVFLEFADAVLASTAVVMTGLKVGTRSVRVERPCYVEGGVVFPSPLDVQPLRDELLLPNSYAAGSIMVEELLISADRRGVCCDADDLERSITKALIDLESVRQRFPQLTKAVTEVRPVQAGKYAYVTMANEVLASTLVSLGELDLGKARALVNWTPAIAHDKQKKPAPSLEISTVPRLVHIKRIANEAKIDASDASLSLVARSRSPARPHKSPAANEDQACSIYVGNMSGLEAGLLWDAFKKLFDAIPSYKDAYPDGEEPVLKVRTGGPRKDNFSFVQLRSPALVSTAVKIGKMEVGGRSVHLARPANFRQPPEGYFPSLELEDEKLDKVSEGSKQDSVTPPPQLALPPAPPPPPPVRPPVTLWIGNLPCCGADARMLESFLTHECLEAFCTHPSFQAPGLDLTNGPPIKTVTIHPSNRYAFVHVRDAQLGKLLIPIFDGSEYFGRILRAAVAWFGSPSPYSYDNNVEQKSYSQQIGEEEFCDLGEAVAELNMEDL